jgi:hypothetical protein
MSDNNHDRNSLEQKLKVSGYVHPDTDNTNTTPTYMSYREGDTYVSQSYDVYANFNSEDNKQENENNSNMNKLSLNQQQKNTNKLVLTVCPVCDSKAFYSCDCEYADLMCKNRHVWFTTKQGNVIVRDPHEDEE